MALELWLGFVLASAALLIIPGPTVMVVVGRALSHGRQSAWRTVPGVALGDLTAMTLSAAGLGAMLATSAALFTAVKILGAGYLIWLGVQMWRSGPAAPLAKNANPTSPNLFLQSYTVTALNPKSIIFFVAFVPQFLSPAAPLVPQLVILIATFVTLAALNAAVYALVAGSVRSSLRRPSVGVWLDRVGGSVLIGAGAMMLAWRRAT